MKNNVFIGNVSVSYEPKNNVFFDPPRTQFFEKHNIFMPAAGPSMKNNVFMGAGQLGLENNVSKVLTWTARVEKQCFYGSRQLESLENNVSKVLTWTRVFKTMFLWVTSAREFGKQRFQGVDLDARV